MVYILLKRSPMQIDQLIAEPFPLSGKHEHGKLGILYEHPAWFEGCLPSLIEGAWSMQNSAFRTTFSIPEASLSSFGFSSTA